MLASHVTNSHTPAARQLLVMAGGCAGHVVVRFYGEHSSMWVRLEDLTPVELTDDSHLDRLSAMRTHLKLKHKYASHPLPNEMMVKSNHTRSLE